MRADLVGLAVVALTLIGYALLVGVLNGLEQEWPALKRRVRRWRTRRRERAQTERVIARLIRETRSRERV